MQAPKTQLGVLVRSVRINHHNFGCGRQKPFQGTSQRLMDVSFVLSFDGGRMVWAL